MFAQNISEMVSILILCTGNSCRSQMAEGILRSLSSDIKVYSAGTEPASEVHPMAIEVMREIGIDIHEHQPKTTDSFLNMNLDFVITVCEDAKNGCPVFNGFVKNRIHIGFRDPAKASGTENEILGVFREVRDQIRKEMGRFYNYCI